MSDRADNKRNTKTAMAGDKDFISALPDDVLGYLLSFLPSRNAVWTCVLAKRWRTLWKSVPALRIKDDRQGWHDDEDPFGLEHRPEEFANADELEYNSRMFTFVNELLRLRDPTPLNVCEIFSSYADMTKNDEDEAFQRIEPSIQYALSHKVQVLDVYADSRTTDLAPVSSHLKRVELTSIQLEGSLDFSSCPVLDVLEMSDCTISGSILSQSLRHLEIEDGSFDYDSMPSLVTASVGESTENELQNVEESFSVVLEGLSSATNLELTTPFYQNSVFRTDLKWCPMFSKLKTLLVNEWCMAANFTGLVYLLQHSPILEMLTLDLDIPKYEEYCLIKTIESCNSKEQGYNSRDQSLLSKHLKVVKIICGKKDGEKAFT